MRLFVALTLPEDVRMRLAGLTNGLPGARWVKPENLHLTLRFLGELDNLAAADVDDEFYLTGVAEHAPDPAVVERVAAAQIARGATTSRDESAFRLAIERALYSRYKPRGQPDNWPPEYLKWSSA